MHVCIEERKRETVCVCVCVCACVCLMLYAFAYVPACSLCPGTYGTCSHHVHKLHFFDLEANRRRGLSWYLGHFRPRKGIYGAGSPKLVSLCFSVTQSRYMFMYDAPPDIAYHIGVHFKAIMLLRNPAERAWSGE